MVFAYGYIPLPSRSWQLADVWDDPVELRKMLLWAQHIMQLRRSLLQPRPLLAEMLAVNPEARVASHALASRLQSKGLLGMKKVDLMLQDDSNCQTHTILALWHLYQETATRSMYIRGYRPRPIDVEAGRCGGGHAHGGYFGNALQAASYDGHEEVVWTVRGQ